MDDRPDLYDTTVDPNLWSNTSIGGIRLTWRELVEHQNQELARLREHANLLADLDRCEHGRHEGDICGGCNGPSRGNPVVHQAHDYRTGLLVDPEQELPRLIGYTLGGSPIFVPSRGQGWGEGSGG